MAQRITQAEIDVVINACQIKIDTLTDEAAVKYARRKNYDSEIAQVTHLRKLIVNLQKEDGLEDNPLEIIYYEAIDRSGLLDLPVESTTLTLNNTSVGNIIFAQNPAADDFWKKTGTTVISNPTLQGVPSFTGNVNIGNDITFTPTVSGSVLDNLLVRNPTTKEIEIRDASTIGASHTFGDHSDVTITTIVDGEIPRWNGSIWINNTLAEAGIAAQVHTHAWSDIVSGKPTTLAGYGITNAYTKTEVDAIVALYELDLGTPASSGYILSSTTGDVRSWIAPYSDTDARNALSSTATGLTYTSATGVFSLTSGYEIPLSTSTAQWDLAYGWGDHSVAGYSLNTHTFASHPDVDVATQSDFDLLFRNGSKWHDTNGLLTWNESNFNINGTISINGGEQMDWNDDFHTLNIPTGTGSTLQTGQEFYFLIYNDTGVEIANGAIVKPIAGFPVGGVVLPTVILAQADNHETCEGTLFMATSDIAIAGTGMATRLGRVSFDTNSFSPGDDLFLSPTVAGGITSTRPSFPDYTITLGGVIESAVDGVVGFNVTRNVQDTALNAWDGGIRESFDFTVTAAGGVITGSLEEGDGGGGDLTMMFHDGLAIFDCTPAATIVLTAGTDIAPQENFIYIPDSTRVLTLSTSEWPTDEHIKIANVLLQSATETALGNALSNRNWNDHVKIVNDNGHLLHISERIRQLPASWLSGTEGAIALDVVPTPDDLFITVTGGKVYQLHRHDFPAFDTEVSDHFHVANNFAEAYVKESNLNTQILDALGNSLNNKSFSFVLWGVQNKTGQESNIFINLPTGSYAYNFPNTAIEDASNYSVYTIPDEFKGNAFLIARFTMTYKNNAWTIEATEDLRGSIPNTSAGGGAGGIGVTTFLALTDTNNAYGGFAGTWPIVNAGETGLEFDTSIRYSAGNAEPSSFTLTSGVTNSTKQITFDVNTTLREGDLITGTNIKANTFIRTVTSTTTADLSRKASASSSGITFTIYPANTSLDIVSNLTGTNSPVYGVVIENDFSGNTDDGAGLEIRSRFPTAADKFATALSLKSNTNSQIKFSTLKGSSNNKSWHMGAENTGNDSELVIFRDDDDGAGGTTELLRFPRAGQAVTINSFLVSTAGNVLYLYGGHDTAGVPAVVARSLNNTLTYTSNEHIIFSPSYGNGGDEFAPTSGNGDMTWIKINPTINQTGGASGVTRGIYINPTLTSAADFRAIDYAGLFYTSADGSATANSFIKSGGASSEFLKADGSVDSTSYGEGTVTSVSGGTALTSTGGTTPSLSLDNTAVTPAAYTSADITVDAQGRITAAANGAAGVFLEAHVQLNQSQIQNLATTAIEIIALPGANKYIQIIGASAFLDHNGTSYAVANDLILEYNGSATRYFDTSTLANFIGNSADFTCTLGMTGGGVAINTAIDITADADATGNGGTIDVYIQYMEIDTT